MNTQRFVWGATVLLFAIVGVITGYYAGVAYPRLPIAGVEGAHLPYVPPVLSVGLCIVMARMGSLLADRFLLPAVRRLDEFSVADRILGVSGALLGLLFGVLITIPIDNTPVLMIVKFCVLAVCAALGMAILGGMRGEMLRVFPRLSEEAVPGDLGAMPKFLDTNIIIDGRLGDICKTGFIEGPLYVPQFVLEEVQYVADSSDGLRRARGRRGLDVLNAMKELTVTRHVGDEVVSIPVVHVLNEISPAVQKIKAVDSKLVALAKEKDGAIITNDFNLNKVAELQGVLVLNLNELAQAMKPVVLPGEEMVVTIVKEGKEAGQGIGYLEDGTMVVVGDGIDHVGENCPVIISSVYQTVAGKMIFADLKDKDQAPPTKATIRGAGDDLFGEPQQQEQPRDGRGGRSGDDNNGRSGGGMRRKGRS